MTPTSDDVPGSTAQVAFWVLDVAQCVMPFAYKSSPIVHEGSYNKGREHNQEKQTLIVHIAGLRD